MRIAVFSDIHANLEALQAVLKDMRTHGCSRFFCCRDVVGYGASPNECCRELQEQQVATVKGNHDEAVALDTPLPNGDFNPVAAASVQWTRQYTTTSNRNWLEELPLVCVDRKLGVTLCHSAPVEPDSWVYLTTPSMAAPIFAAMETPVCFIGHSHSAAVFWKETDGHIAMVPPCRIHLRAGERYIINVGSVGQPRDHDSRASYFIYDYSSGVIFPMRVNYWVEGAQQRIRQAGLPEKLACRLALGL